MIMSIFKLQLVTSNSKLAFYVSCLLVTLDDHQKAERDHLLFNLHEKLGLKIK